MPGFDSKTLKRSRRKGRGHVNIDTLLLKAVEKELVEVGIYGGKKKGVLKDKYVSPREWRRMQKN